MLSLKTIGKAMKNIGSHRKAFWRIFVRVPVGICSFAPSPRLRMLGCPVHEIQRGRIPLGNT